MSSSACEKHTISLSTEQGRYIDRLVKSGAYASASEVVRAGLDALEERDETEESWLKTGAVTAYDQLEADPDSAIPAKQIFSEVRALVDKGKKAGR